MKVTKYEHSCLDIVQGKTRIVVDPGEFSKTFKDYENIAAIVITHVHPDHFSPITIKDIIEQNPEIQIFAPPEVATQNRTNSIPVKDGDKHTVGDFTLEFFGTDHALIDKTYKKAQNTGVLINEKLYYPGDSWTVCPKAYEWLGMPSHAPWAKHSDAMDFLRESNAKNIFPMHNVFLNEDGMALYERLLSSGAEATGKGYKMLQVGDILKI